MSINYEGRLNNILAGVEDIMFNKFGVLTDNEVKLINDIKSALDQILEKDKDERLDDNTIV